MIRDDNGLAVTQERIADAARRAEFLTQHATQTTAESG
jgi:hypothetical protein